MESKALRIPLEKKRYSFSIFLFSLLVGWLWNRSFQIAPSLVSAFVGGSILWLLLASPMALKLYKHQSGLVRFSSIAAGVVLLVGLQSNLVPWLMEAASKHA